MVRATGQRYVGGRWSRRGSDEDTFLLAEGMLAHWYSRFFGCDSVCQSLDVESQLVGLRYEGA